MEELEDALPLVFTNVDEDAVDLSKSFVEALHGMSVTLLRCCVCSEGARITRNSDKKRKNVSRRWRLDVTDRVTLFSSRRTS